MTPNVCDRIVGRHSLSFIAHAKVFASHTSGMTDHYTKRKPGIVAAACKGIERFYFGDTSIGPEEDRE